jgi:hypothetical protein
MTTNAATWFYHAPEKNLYLIGERVRTTYWDERIGGLWLDAVQVEAPVMMQGTYNGAAVKLEWEPGQWLRLATAPASPFLANVTGNILRRKPALRYEDAEGHTVWEWRLADADKRWQEIQGMPMFHNPQKLD